MCTREVSSKWSVLIGCILLSLTLGFVYSFGNMLPYFSSFIAFSNRNYSDSLNAAYSEYQYRTATIYCLLIVFQSQSMSIGSRAYITLGIGHCCLIGCFIMSFGIGLTYFTCNNLVLCCLTYGIMPGIGVGIVLSHLTVLIHRNHFSKKL